MNIRKIPRHIWLGVALPAVLVSIGLWQGWPRLVEYREHDERKAAKGLLLICTTQLQFSTPPDPTQNVSDTRFWTGDVSGVFSGINIPQGSDIARADSASLDPLDPQPTPFHGYLFQALARDTSTTPPEEYRKTVDLLGRRSYHPSRFAYCAYPATYDWRHKYTFIMNQDGKLYSTDNEGAPVTEWPAREVLSTRWRLEVQR